MAEKEIVKGVERIIIDKEKIVLYGLGYHDFPRKDWRLFAEDVQQVQVFEENVLLINVGKGPISCEIVRGRKWIFCGKEPEKVRIL